MSLVAESSQYYSGFSPQSIPGCQLWLDAADSNTFTYSGANIIQWNDKSGRGAHASNSTGSSLPTLGTNSVSLPAVDFNTAYLQNETPMVVTSNTTFIVAEERTAGANRGTYYGFLVFKPVSGGPAAGTDDFSRSNSLIFATPNNESLSLLTYGFIGAFPQLNFTGNGNMNYGLYTAVIRNDAIASTSFLNNTSNSSYVLPTRTSNSVGYLLAARQLVSASLLGKYKISEIISYSNVLTTFQREQVETYLARKWGTPTFNLPVSLRYRTTIVSTGSTVPVTAPTDIAGCQLWLDASDSTTLILSGSNVTQWNDKSGNGRNTTAVVGTPTLTSNAVNSRRGVYFNGTSYFTGPFSYSSNALTWFVVGSIESDGEGYGRLLSLGTAGTFDFDSPSRMNALSREATTTEIVVYRNNFVGRGLFITYGSPFIFSSVLDGTSNFPYLNGMLGTSFASSGNFGFDTYGVSGSFGANVNRNKGHIFEIAIFNRNLTTSERQRVELYLANKWNLTVTSTSVSNISLMPISLRRFHPLDISGCQLWLDAADSTTLTLSGSNVTQWNDKSGNGYNAVSNVGTGTYNATGMNSRPSIEITPTGNMVVPIPAGTFSAGFAAFVVFQKTGANNTYDTVISRIMPNGTQAPFDMYSYDTNTTGRFTGNGSANLGSITSGSLARTTTPTIWFANVSPTLGTVWAESVNGTFTTYNMTVNAGSYGDVASNFHIGTRADNVTKMTGRISEIILYNRSNLTDAQRQQIEGYLAQRWGLGTSFLSSHPFQYNIPLTAPFLPTQISGCQLWLDAADIGTLTLSGSNVTQWNDKSGNGRVASGFVGSGTYSSNGLNSYPTIQITPTGNMIAPVPSGTFPNQITVFVVYQKTGTNAVFDTIITRVISGNQPAPFDIYGNSTSDVRFAGNGSSYRYTTSAFGVYSRTTPTILSINLVYSTPGSWNEGVNGTISTYNLSNVVGDGTLADNASNFYIGTRMDSVTKMVGNISEIICYSSLLTTGERQQIEGYLAWKWGLRQNLPTTHPYYKINPS